MFNKNYYSKGMTGTTNYKQTSDSTFIKGVQYYLDNQGTVATPQNCNNGGKLYEQVSGSYFETTDTYFKEKTYYSDNSVQSTLYYDINGNPFRMSEGQYGIKNKNGQTVYLNADGTEQFNVKNFVHNRSEFVIAIASVIVVLSAFTDRKMNWLMLIIYAGVILYFTLMFRETGQRKIGLLHSYRAFFRNAEVRASIIKNIWLFIPLGAILYRLFPRTTILFVPILISVAIEAVQYLTGTGFCELDDVISNSMGGVIGYGMAFLFQSIRRQFCNNLIT